VREGRIGGALLPAGGTLGHHAAVAERVRLVEEDDHPDVPQREPAQLAEERRDAVTVRRRRPTSGIGAGPGVRVGA